MNFNQLPVHKATDSFSSALSLIYFAKLLQLCLTLCAPMDSHPPGSSVYGIFRARILEWVAIFFSRGSSWYRNWIHVFCVSCIWQEGSLPLASPGKPCTLITKPHLNKPSIDKEQFCSLLFEFLIYSYHDIFILSNRFEWPSITFYDCCPYVILISHQLTFKTWSLCLKRHSHYRYSKYLLWFREKWICAWYCVQDHVMPKK